MARPRQKLSDRVAGSALVPNVEELLPTDSPPTPQSSSPPEASPVRVLLTKIHRSFTFTPNNKPVRQYYDLEKIRVWATANLAESGVNSPIWVRPHPTIPGEYELIAGLRRVLGSELIGLLDIPVIVYNWTDAQAYAAAVYENSGREDFSPLEETDNSLSLLSIKLDLSVEEVAQLLRKLLNQAQRSPEKNVFFSDQINQIQSVFDFLGQGKWESFTTSRLPLLRLPEDVLEAIRAGEIQYTKGLAIAKLKDPEARGELLEQAITQALSVTQIQERVAELATVGTDVELSKPRPLKQRFSDTVKRLSATKAWSDPDKAKQIEKLLKQLDKLVEDQVAEN